MANHRLYLNEPCEGQVGKSTKYQYADGVLEIEWQGERAWFYFPQKTAVLIKCEGTMPDAVPLIYPANFRWRSLWLCGVPKKGRCGTCTEFNEKVAQGEFHRQSEGNGWKIAWGLDERGTERVALGWISGKVSDRDVWKMVKACRVAAPRWFIREVLGF